MMALFIAITAVAVERFINKRRLKVHEVLADVGWLTLIFALIEFAWLYIVEAGTLAYGSAMRLFWYIEWAVFKHLMFEAAVGVFLILVAVWLESAGLRIELRRPSVKMLSALGSRRPDAPRRQLAASKTDKKCNIEWHEAS